jgi:hypothetical protein
MQLGFTSKSHGKGAGRCVTVYKVRERLRARARAHTRFLRLCLRRAFCVCVVRLP